MSALSIRHLISGGVIVNYHCVSRCGHCRYNCSPKRPEDYLDGAAAEKIFTRIAALGCRSMHIGGGEPLREPKPLVGVMQAAVRTGMGIHYVETHSAWFVDEKSATAILEELKSEGLRTLLVSISPFHNAHIPFARTKGVMAACHQAGTNVFP